MELQPPHTHTLCCAPTCETTPVTVGTAGLGDRHGSPRGLSSSPHPGGLGGHWSPPSPVTLEGKVTVPECHPVGSAPCWGSCPPTALTQGVSPKRTADSHATLPVCPAGSLLVPVRGAEGKQQVSAAGRRRGRLSKPARKSPPLKIQNKIPKPGVQGRRVQLRISQAGKLPSSPLLPPKNSPPKSVFGALGFKPLLLPFRPWGKQRRVLGSEEPLPWEGAPSNLGGLFP